MTITGIVCLFNIFTTLLTMGPGVVSSSTKNSAKRAINMQFDACIEVITPHHDKIIMTPLLWQ